MTLHPHKIQASEPYAKPENPVRVKTSARENGKAASAFRTISEVAELLAVQQHVLRFWESKFSQVRPLKRGGGRRYYRPEDVELLKSIHHLLYTQGYTIKGVQKLFREQGKTKIRDAAPAPDATVTIESEQTAAASTGTNTHKEPTLSNHHRQILEAMLAELKELRAILAD